jgi:hypothetical protein
MSETEQATDWREALPESLREAPYFKNAETVDQVLADLQGAAAWQGNSLRIPGPDATPEQVAEFRAKAQERIPGLMAVPDPDAEDYTDTLRKLGLPEAADKYKAPEDCPIEGEQLGNLMAEAFDAGLTQAQFAKLLNKQVDAMRSAQEQFEAQHAAETTALKGEWGEAYQDRMDQVNAFLAEAPEALRDALPTLDAESVRWLHNLAENMRESNQTVRQADGQRAVMTPAEASEQLQELTARLTTMRETDNPQLYQSLVQKRVDLVKAATAGR